MRYICCGCGLRYAHRVLGYELVEGVCDSFVRITISSPEIDEGSCFCVSFKSIPAGLKSYPIKVVINGVDIAVVNSTRDITTADLRECILLCGVYKDSVYTVC